MYSKKAIYLGFGRSRINTDLPHAIWPGDSQWDKSEWKMPKFWVITSARGWESTTPLWSRCPKKKKMVAMFRQQRKFDLLTLQLYSCGSPSAGWLYTNFVKERWLLHNFSGGKPAANCSELEHWAEPGPSYPWTSLQTGDCSLPAKNGQKHRQKPLVSHHRKSCPLAIITENLHQKYRWFLP